MAKHAKPKAGGQAATVRVKLVRSPIGFDRRQGAVVVGMGLRRIGQVVELKDGPAARGMIRKVRHLVAVVE